MEMGAQNFVGLIFGATHKLAWHKSRCGKLNSTAHKLALAGISYPARFIEGSTKQC